MAGGVPRHRARIACSTACRSRDAPSAGRRCIADQDADPGGDVRVWVVERAGMVVGLRCDRAFARRRHRPRNRGGPGDLRRPGGVVHGTRLRPAARGRDRPAGARLRAAGPLGAPGQPPRSTLLRAGRLARGRRTAADRFRRGAGRRDPLPPGRADPLPAPRRTRLAYHRDHDRHDRSPGRPVRPGSGVPRRQPVRHRRDDRSRRGATPGRPLVPARWRRDRAEQRGRAPLAGEPAAGPADLALRHGRCRRVPLGGADRRRRAP